MRKGNMRSTILMMAAWILAGCAGHHRVDIIKETYPDVQARIQKMVPEIFEAARTKNFDKLEQAHLAGSKFTKFDDWEPLTRQDAATAQKAEKEGFSAVTDFAYKIKDLKVDVFGRAAVATYEIDYSMKLGKESAATRARATMVFVKQGQDWKIAHEHFSSFKPNP